MRLPVLALLLMTTAISLPGVTHAQSPSSSLSTQAGGDDWIADAMIGLKGQGFNNRDISQTFQVYNYNISSSQVTGIINGTLSSYDRTGSKSEMRQYLTDRNLGHVFQNAGYGSVGYTPVGHAGLDAVLDQFARGNAGPGGSQCSAAAMSALSSAVGVASGIFSLGLATVVAQFAQQLQLIQANVCSGVQNDHLDASNKNEALMIDYMIEMLKSTDWSNQNVAVNSIQQMAGVIASGGQTYDLPSVAPDYSGAYPVTYGSEKTNEDIQWESNAMMERQRGTQVAAQEQQAHSVSMINQRPQRVAEIMQAARDAPGPTAVGQEQIKMDALLVESISALHADQIATERARLNEMARAQQDRAMSERVFENAMKGWGECSRCGKAKMSWTANQENGR